MTLSPVHVIAVLACAVEGAPLDFRLTHNADAQTHLDAAARIGLIAPVTGLLAPTAAGRGFYITQRLSRLPAGPVSGWSLEDDEIVCDTADKIEALAAERAAAAAAARTSYRLTFRHAAAGQPCVLDTRVVDPGEVPSLFTDALTDGVVHALNQFRVDGQLWLDPHGPHASSIRALTAVCASELAAIAAAGQPAARIILSCPLAFAQTPASRPMGRGWLDGPALPDARVPGRMSPGEWTDGNDELNTDSSVEYWIGRYTNYVINEAAHEVMEWFRTGEEHWLDPDGPAQLDILDATNGLADRLSTIATRVGGVPAGSSTLLMSWAAV